MSLSFQRIDSGLVNSSLREHNSTLNSLLASQSADRKKSKPKKKAKTSQYTHDVS